MHQAVVFDEFDAWFVDTFKMDCFPMVGITERRLYLKKRIRELKLGRCDLERLLQLQQLERLERLQRLQQLRIDISSLDYRAVQIKQDSIIYCDIPYKGTRQYTSGDFDHDAFYEWANDQDQPVFISEYEIKDDRFFLVDEIEVRSTLSATNKSKKAVERLYCNNAALRLSCAA